MENLRIDENGRNVLGAITNDANEYIKNLRVNPITGRLLVDAVVGSTNTQIGSTIPGGTAGSVLFLGLGATLAQDNANFFYDDTNNYLGLGTNTPSATLDVQGTLIYNDGSPAADYVLVSTDNLGSATWQDLSANTTFINNLANNATFISDLIANTTFTTDLANDSNFYTTLAGNSSFLTLLGGNVAVAVDGVTITGDGTTGNPLVAVTGGTGTVTSVGLTMPTGFSVANSPITTSGTLAVTTALAGIVHAGSGAFTAIPLTTDGAILIGDGAGAPTTLNAFSSATGTLKLANGGTAANLTDPGANRLWGWDDTDNSIGFWTIGSGLSYDHATHTLSSTGTGASATFTATQDITAGDPVGASSGKDGYVSIAGYNLKSVVTSDQIDTSYDIAFIDTDKFVAFTDSAEVIIGVIDDANEVTFGTPSSTITGMTGARSVCKIDTNKFLVSYQINNGTYEIHAIAGTVSGTTITLGSNITVDSNIGIGATDGISCASAATDEAVVTFVDNTVDVNGYAMTISGTTITAGSYLNIQGSATSFAIDTGACKKGLTNIGTGKYALAYVKNVIGTYSYEVIILEQSTITLTKGSAVILESSGSTADWSSQGTGTDTFFVTKNTGSTGNTYYVTVSGTVPTAGSPVVSLGSYFDGTDMFLRLGSSLFTWNRYTISGNTLSTTTDGAFYSYLNGVIAKYQNGAQFSFGSATLTFEYWNGGMSNNFIGVALSTVAKGASITVQLSGEATITQDINSGSYYRVEDGVFTLITATTLSTYNFWGTVKGSGLNKIII